MVVTLKMTNFSQLLAILLNFARLPKLAFNVKAEKNASQGTVSSLSVLAIYSQVTKHFVSKLCVVK